MFRLPITLVASLLILTGCASTTYVGTNENETDLAVIYGKTPGFGSFFTENEAHCYIMAVDGIDGGIGTPKRYMVQPGEHTLELSMTHMSHHFSGTYKVFIREAKEYQLTAKKKFNILSEEEDKNEFELYLIDVERDRVVSSSRVLPNSNLPLIVYVPR